MCYNRQEKREGKKMKRVLFICHGNICRSVMAEFIMKELAAREGRRDLEIASAATTDEEHGNPVYPNARRELERYGIPCGEHCARRMKAEDYDRFDLLIGMDRENLRDMRRICGGDPDGKLRLLLDFTDRPGDVADPWYTRDFAIAFRDIDEGCRALLEQL